MARIARPVWRAAALPPFDVHVGPELAGVHGAVGSERAVTRDVEQVAVPDGRHVGRHRLGGGGQFQLQFGQAGFGSHGRGSRFCAGGSRSIRREITGQKLTAAGCQINGQGLRRRRADLTSPVAGTHGRMAASLSMLSEESIDWR